MIGDPGAAKPGQHVDRRVEHRGPHAAARVADVVEHAATATTPRLVDRPGGRLRAAARRPAPRCAGGGARRGARTPAGPWLIGRRRSRAVARPARRPGTCRRGRCRRPPTAGSARRRAAAPAGSRAADDVGLGLHDDHRRVDRRCGSSCGSPTKTSTMLDRRRRARRAERADRTRLWIRNPSNISVSGCTPLT